MRRLYNALCSLIEGTGNYFNARAEYLRQPDPEPQPEGAFTDHERSGAYEPDELHAEQYRIGFAPRSRV